MQLDKHYISLLENIKSSILKARITTIRKINKELIQLYLAIGRMILEEQEVHKWGKSIVEQLSKDLKKTFPNSKGFSARNLWEMRRLYERYQHSEFLQQLVAEIPWGHNMLILSKIKTKEEIIFYASSTAKYGWSRNVLLNQIKANAYQRSLTENKQHNFLQVLPQHFAEQASESIKSSYNLDFLGVKSFYWNFTLCFQR